MESFWTGDRTPVPCISRWILDPLCHQVKSCRCVSDTSMGGGALNVYLLFCQLGTTVFFFFFNLVFVLIEVEALGQ